MSLTKNSKPKTKIFFSLQTRNLAESFKGLNRSFTQSTGELCSSKLVRKQHFQSMTYTSAAEVLTSIVAVTRISMVTVMQQTHFTKVLLLTQMFYIADGNAVVCQFSIELSHCFHAKSFVFVWWKSKDPGHWHSVAIRNKFSLSL